MLILSIVVFSATIAGGLYALLRERRTRLWSNNAKAVEDKPVMNKAEEDEPIHPAEVEPALFTGLRLHREKNVTLWVRVGITALAAPFVGFLILSKSADASTKNFAFTTVGTILGYWLSATPK